MKDKKKNDEKLNDKGTTKSNKEQKSNPCDAELYEPVVA